MLALVVLTLLCSSYCAVQGMVVPKIVVPDDRENWANIWKYQKLNPLLSRTTNSNESVIDIIIRANSEERGKEKPARSGDSGIFLFEGDIVMNKSEVLKLMPENFQGKNRTKRAVMRKTKTSLWQHNIPYALNSRLSSRAKSVIRSAIREWEETLPCMGKWSDVTKKSRPRNYLYFFRGGGCYSQVGRQGGRQRVSIGRGCEYHGVVVHEIGHAMGLWHEQSRPDRDEFVKVNWKNIISGMEFNFQKYTTARIDSLGQTYDYRSVMHYGPSAFAKRRGAKTIESKKGNQRLGQRNNLSPSDKKQVQLLYECTSTATKSPSVCRNTATHNNWCSESAKLGLCSNSLFRRYMATHCCSTCRKTTTTSSGGCVNKQSKNNCNRWMRRGFCAEKNKYRKYMQKNCCKTCRSAAPQQKCEDKSSDCSSWKSSGFCISRTYVNYMKRNCAKSCGCHST